MLFALLIIAIIIPGLLDFLTNLFGFQTASNMILSTFIAVLIVINIASTIVVSRHSKKINKLIQEIAILKKGYSDKKND